jgi:hypothetical protein
MSLEEKERYLRHKRAMRQKKKHTPKENER